MFALGMAYSDGRCVAKDEKRAVKWLEMATRNRHLEATYQLALHHYIADRTRLATKYFRIAARREHSEAQHHLGIIMLEASAPREQIQEGLYWLGASAGNGFWFSALVLGMLHERGLRGVAKNACLALDWYEASHLLGAADGIGHLHRLAMGDARTCIAIVERKKSGR